MSLQTFSALPLSWDDKKKELSLSGKILIPDIRTLEQMREVIYDKRWLASANPRMPLYYMYRDVCLPEDKEAIASAGLRYDITVFPPQMLGREYLKSAGHYHPHVPGQNVSYPELYEVVSGEAIFLIQKVGGKKVLDARVVHAKEGDKLLIPPGFGHITINPAKTTLITANWVARDFSSEYGPIKTLGGGAYFFTTKGIVKNPSYENNTDEPKKLGTTPARILGLSEKEPMYSLVKSKGSLEFLTSPQKFSALFEKALAQ